MKTIRGFTLIELMVIVAIIGILAAIAIPNIREMTASNRQLTASNELVSSFSQARHTAVSLSREVQISANSGNWRNGWTVTALPYTAIAPDGTLNNYPQDVVSTHEGLSSQLDLAAGITTFTYNRQGRLNIAGTASITICDNRTGEKGRQVTLEPIGRVSITSVNCP